MYSWESGRTLKTPGSLNTRIGFNWGDGGICFHNHNAVIRIKKVPLVTLASNISSADIQVLATVMSFIVKTKFFFLAQGPI